MIKIHKIDALIGINTSQAKLSISQPKADFDLHQKHAKVIIKTEPIRIEIDQTQCFNEVGLKNNRALSDDMVSRGKQALSEGIDRIVSDGNAMAAIENHSDAIAEIAAINSLQVLEFNIEFLPKSRPIIDFIGGNVDIRVDEGYVELKTKPNKPIIDVQVGDVEIYMKQHPEIKFEYVGSELDRKL